MKRSFLQIRGLGIILTALPLRNARIIYLDPGGSVTARFR
jgi:hypothetical protein